MPGLCAAVRDLCTGEHASNPNPGETAAAALAALTCARLKPQLLPTVLTQITTLIPAYKTKYMVELLTGLATQTHKPARILISDDSPNGEFTELLRTMPVAHRLPIEVCAGPKNGAYENFKHLVRHWNGSTDLFHILLDDDVLFPDFYARHVMAHAMAPETACSISARWTANERCSLPPSPSARTGWASFPTA